MKAFIKNLFLPKDKYRYHSEAVVISCFYNPANSPYRLSAFKQWYESIKHLNHRVTELAIGNGDFQLPDSPFIDKIRTSSLLWHKETLLNRIVFSLPREFKYVFWVDADVLFDNTSWLVDGVEQMQRGINVLQPFEYCVHLKKDQQSPDFDLGMLPYLSSKDQRQLSAWKSYCANFAANGPAIFPLPYDVRGHVGFAWGAKRGILDQLPLYDNALIGGADGIMAYASTGDILNKSIIDSFGHKGDLTDIRLFSKKWYSLVNAKVGFVRGNLLHLWHGDIEKRNYLKRIQDFTPKSSHISDRDENGLHTNTDPVTEAYIHNYFNYREVLPETSVIESVGNQEPLRFGGGDFGGAGAEGSYGDAEVRTEGALTGTVELGAASLLSKDADWANTDADWSSHDTIS